jgi:hypothetical protein
MWRAFNRTGVLMSVLSGTKNQYWITACFFRYRPTHDDTKKTASHRKHFSIFSFASYKTEGSPGSSSCHLGFCKHCVNKCYTTHVDQHFNMFCARDTSLRTTNVASQFFFLSFFLFCFLPSFFLSFFSFSSFPSSVFFLSYPSFKKQLWWPTADTERGKHAFLWTALQRFAFKFNIQALISARSPAIQSFFTVCLHADADITLKFDHNRFLPVPSQFIVHSHPFIWH